MPIFEPISAHRQPTGEIEPRLPHREVADLLAIALLRLRERNDSPPEPENGRQTRAVRLGFSGHQRVHDNPSEPSGERQ